MAETGTSDHRQALRRRHRRRHEAVAHLTQLPAAAELHAARRPGTSLTARWLTGQAESPLVTPLGITPPP